MVDSIVAALKKGKVATAEEISELFDGMLEGKLSKEETKDVLRAMANRGEKPHEIAAAALSLRKHADTLNTGMEILDTCGTGGDGKQTFNISTAAAIICSLFVPVAKHGNRSVSSKCGSADLLESVNIPIDLKKDKAYEMLKEKNFTFLFAPLYHPAMKHVAQARRELGIRTIFNLVGPLANPFKPAFQLIGVFSKDFLEPMFEATRLLGMENVILVSSVDGMDEISLSDKTVCYRREGLHEEKFEFDPVEFGIQAPMSALVGADAATNAQLMIETFRGEHEHLRNAICINAAFALVVSGFDDSVESAFKATTEAVLSGKAYEKLMELKNARTA